MNVETENCGRQYDPWASAIEGALRDAVGAVAPSSREGISLYGESAAPPALGLVATKHAVETPAEEPGGNGWAEPCGGARIHRREHGGYFC